MNFVQPIRDTEQIERMKEILKYNNVRDYMLFVLGINTGLRISDILPLMKKDVMGTHIVLKEKKTGKRKFIRITPQLKLELYGYTENMSPNDYLFPSRNGENTPICRSTAYRILNGAAEQIRLRHIGTHTLRKTFGYHFYSQRKDVALLQEIFNHSSPEITLRYIGVNQDTVDKAMTKFKI